MVKKRQNTATVSDVDFEKKIREDLVAIIGNCFPDLEMTESELGCKWVDLALVCEDIVMIERLLAEKLNLSMTPEDMTVGGGYPETPKEMVQRFKQKIKSLNSEAEAA